MCCCVALMTGCVAPGPDPVAGIQRARARRPGPFITGPHRAARVHHARFVEPVVAAAATAAVVLGLVVLLRGPVAFTQRLHDVGYFYNTAAVVTPSPRDGSVFGERTVRWDGQRYGVCYRSLWLTCHEERVENKNASKPTKSE